MTKCSELGSKLYGGLFFGKPKNHPPIIFDYDAGDTCHPELAEGLLSMKTSPHSIPFNKTFASGAFAFFNEITCFNMALASAFLFWFNKDFAFNRSAFS